MLTIMCVYIVGRLLWILCFQWFQGCLPTRKDEDEEGTDSSNDTDDLAHVRNKHGDEKSDGDPDDSENDSAATLK